MVALELEDGRPIVAKHRRVARKFAPQSSYTNTHKLFTAFTVERTMEVDKYDND